MQRQVGENNVERWLIFIPAVRVATGWRPRMQPGRTGGCRDRRKKLIRELRTLSEEDQILISLQMKGTKAPSDIHGWSSYTSATGYHGPSADLGLVSVASEILLD